MIVKLKVYRKDWIYKPVLNVLYFSSISSKIYC